MVGFYFAKNPGGWEQDCEKVDYVYIQLKDTRLKIPREDAQYFYFSEQSKFDKNVFCKQNEGRLLQVQGFGINHSKKVNTIPFQKLPRGLRQALVSERVEQTKFPLKRERCSLSYSETQNNCIVHKNLAVNNDLSIRYMFSGPSDLDNGNEVIISDKYPGALYPRASWEALFEEVETYIQSLIVE